MSYNYNQVLYNLRKQKQKRILNNLKTGDLIKVQSDINSLIHHYGIVEREGSELYIWHVHPDKKNIFGGSTVKENLEAWIKSKQIVSYESTNIDVNDIKDLFQELKYHQYDFLNFNCEHFVNFVKNKKYVSPQVIKYTSLLALGFLVYYLIKNKKV